MHLLRLARTIKKIIDTCNIAGAIDISAINLDRECHINGLLKCKIENVAYDGEVYCDILGDTACSLQLDVFKEKRITASIEFGVDILQNTVSNNYFGIATAKTDTSFGLYYYTDSLPTNQIKCIYYDAQKKQISGHLQNVQLAISQSWSKKYPKKKFLLENLIFKASTTPRVKKCLRCGTM